MNVKSERLDEPEPEILMDVTKLWSRLMIELYWQTRINQSLDIVENYEL